MKYMTSESDSHPCGVAVKVHEDIYLSVNSLELRCLSRYTPYLLRKGHGAYFIFSCLWCGAYSRGSIFKSLIPQRQNILTIQ